MIFQWESNTLTIQQMTFSIYMVQVIFKYRKADSITI